MVYFAMLRLNPFFYFRQKRGDDGRCYSVYMFLILVNKALWPIGNKIGGARRPGGRERKLVGVKM